MAEDGDFRGAIDTLTAANRAARDDRLERRLIELRSAAAEAFVWPESRPPWPEHVPNRFEGTPFPEIDASDLDLDVLRSAMTHQGSLHVRGVVGSSRVAELRDDIDRALSSFDVVASGDEDADTRRWYTPFSRDKASDRERKRSRGSILTVESPATMFDLVETFRETGLDRLVCEYFGEEPLLLGRKGTLRRIAHGGNTGGWHQDGAFMGSGIRSLNIWIPLTHCGDTAPGMDLVAKRLDYIVPTGDGAFSPWATSPAEAEKVAEGALVRPIFEPGDALFFDQMNLHRTAIDPEMTEDRHAIETWLLSPSTYVEMMRPNDEGYSPRDQIPILF
ncbi:MAG: phytanoyl-CoA dioxygenase family protein [Acidimicrobiales bacterium]